MKKLRAILILSFIALSLTGYSQLNVDSYGNTTIKYGTFSPGVDAILNFGNSDHYIKSIFGYGIKIGTVGATDILRIKQYGTIGINRDPDSSFKLDVNGNIRVNTTTYSSDQRLKTDINLTTNSFDKINQIQGVSYKMISDDSLRQGESLKPDVNRQFGFIAQDFQKIFPELIYEDSKGYLSIDYVSMIPVLIEAIKTQQIQIEDLKKQLESLTK